MSEKVYWLINSKEDHPYKKTTWYRCVGIEDFVKKVEEKHEIVGFMADRNNLGFMIEEK